MKKAITLVALAFMFAACNSANNSHPSAKYEEKKASLEEMEHDSPLKFLKVTGSCRGNLVNQTVVEGEVINKSTLTSYKNVKLSITFLDNEGATIDKQKETLDDVMEPASTNSYKIKVGHVKGLSKVSVDIVDADAVTK